LQKEVNIPVVVKLKLVIWLLFLICLLLLLPHSVNRQQALGVDYPIFYAAALNHGNADGYVYPPLLAWAIYPLARLPYFISSEIWYVLQAIVILALLWKCLPDMRIKRWSTLVVSALFVIATARIVVLNAELGQVNGLVMLLIVVAVQSRQPLPGRSLSLGISTALKLSPAIFFPFFLLRQKGQRLRASLYFLGALTLASVLPWLFGYEFIGLTRLADLSNDPGTDVGLRSIVGSWSTVVSGVLLAISLLAAYRARDRREIMFLPILLMMILPPFVRKAHLLAGLLLGPLVDSEGENLAWVPLLWAIGSIGTMIWTPQLPWRMWRR
jgi:alpha-1,2-mannosyltransferase